MNRSLELLKQLAARETAAPGSADRVRRRLDALLDALQRRQQLAQTYARQAARIAELEAELADSKIAARIGGLLADGACGQDTLAALEAHVAGVLRPGNFGTMLERKLRELEEEIAERKLTAQAKALLQSAYRMSEEQAHLHLRTISRNSRKPLKEVAMKFIEGRISCG